MPLVSAGIYIHIPFCLSKCPYCDFYSTVCDDAAAVRYLDAVVRALPAFPAVPADTLYLGGGTPSLMPPDALARVIEAVRTRFSLPDDAEITMEANPATADLPALRAFRDAGVNRLSVGVQSLDDKVLRAAGRRHTAGEALSFLQDAVQAGFSNLSADVMIGLPGDDGGALQNTLRVLTALPLTHLSAYLLKRMPGTPFYDTPPQGLPDDDALAEQYLLCCSLLEDAGFLQYEISNFAKPGQESRHNLKYWTLRDYIGIGPAAHSCLNGVRYSFSPNTEAFVSSFSPPPRDFRTFARLEGVVDDSDHIMLALRTTKGIDINYLYSLYSSDRKTSLRSFVAQCIGAGLAEITGDSLRLTKQGFLVSNEIIARLLSER